MAEARSIADITTGRELTPSSQCPVPQKRRSPPAAVVSIVSDLGLRYPAASHTDREAHAARVALLAMDLRDENPAHLATAAEQWARTSPFLPKACEMIEACKTLAYAARPYRPLRHTTLAAPGPAKAEVPELSDEDLRAMPLGILRLGLAAGHVDPARVTRLGLATSELLTDRAA